MTSLFTQGAPAAGRSLRPYQIEAMEKLDQAFFVDGHANTVLSLPPSGGKTFTATQWMHKRFLVERPGSQILWVAHREELIEQARDDAMEYCPGAKVTTWYQGGKDLTGDIVVASVPSFRSLLTALADSGRKFILLVIDECHHAAAETYKAVIEGAPHLYRLGLSGTPKRTDGKHFAFDHIAYQVKFMELVNAGWCARPIYLRFRTKQTHLFQIRAGDFTQGSLRSLNNAPRNSMVVRQFFDHPEHWPSMMYTVNVEHAWDLKRDLLDEARKRGMNCRICVVTGETKKDERRQIVADMRAGRVDALLNCFDKDTEILTERGWLRGHQVTTDDVCASMNLKTGYIEWVPVEKVIRRPVETGERMVHIHNQTLDCRVTEGHRMIVRSSPETAWKVVTAGSLATRRGPYMLPMASILEGFLEPIPLTSFELKFIGLFITDGSLNAKRASIEIAQRADSPMCAEIENILTACEFDWKATTKEVTTTLPNGEKFTGTYRRYRIPKGNIGGQLKRRGWGRLEEWLDKSLSPKLSSCTPFQFENLLHGLWIGDGLKQKGRESPATVICGNDWVMLDRLQTLAVTHGWAANLAIHPQSSGKGTLGYLSMRKRPWVQTNNHSVPTSGGNPARFEDASPNEEVWCVSNRNGTVMTRRNGKALIAGQCMVFTEGTDIPTIKSIYLTRPTMSETLYLQMALRGGRSKPGCQATGNDPSPGLKPENHFFIVDFVDSAHHYTAASRGFALRAFDPKQVNGEVGVEDIEKQKALVETMPGAYDEFKKQFRGIKFEDEELTPEEWMLSKVGATMVTSSPWVKEKAMVLTADQDFAVLCGTEYVWKRWDGIRLSKPESMELIRYSYQLFAKDQFDFGSWKDIIEAWVSHKRFKNTVQPNGGRTFVHMSAVESPPLQEVFNAIEEIEKEAAEVDAKLGTSDEAWAQVFDRILTRSPPQHKAYWEEQMAKVQSVSWGDKQLSFYFDGSPAQDDGWLLEMLVTSALRRLLEGADVRVTMTFTNTTYAKCALCTGNLVLRESRNGRFYGCTGYPKCKASARLKSRDDLMKALRWKWDIPT